MRQFRQRATHRFPGQARIRVHDFGDRQAGGERLQDERHGNARAAHTRASAQMFRVSDNPVLHTVKLWQLRNKSSSARRVLFYGGEIFTVPLVAKFSGELKLPNTDALCGVNSRANFCPSASSPHCTLVSTLYPSLSAVSDPRAAARGRRMPP